MAAIRAAMAGRVHGVGGMTRRAGERSMGRLPPSPMVINHVEAAIGGPRGSKLVMDQLSEEQNAFEQPLWRSSCAERLTSASFLAQDQVEGHGEETIQWHFPNETIERQWSSSEAMQNKEAPRAIRLNKSGLLQRNQEKDHLTPKAQQDRPA
eukprot:c48502_g1_i1 orf=17-472(+)